MGGKYRSPLKDKSGRTSEEVNKDSKRNAPGSPETRISKRPHINDWQIREFLWEVLEGMKTKPNYQNLTWTDERSSKDAEETNLEETPAEPPTEEVEGKAVDEED